MNHIVKDIIPGEYNCAAGKVYFELFDKEVDVYSTVYDEQYIQSCADYMNSMSDTLLDELCRVCIKYCNDFLDCVGEPSIEFKNIRDVLKLIHPTVLMVPEPNATMEPVIHMELNCEWEIEHGMEWVIRANKILYVGMYNGEDPWLEDWPQEDWNYAL